MCLILACTFAVFCQLPDSLIVFSGQLFSPDSIPAENVYLISYTNLRAYATDKNGNFTISASLSDSFKVHHVSYESIILKPKTSKQLICLAYRENALAEVTIKHIDRDLQNMNHNMELIKLQLTKEYYYYAKPSGAVVNAYAPPKAPTGFFELNFIELLERATRLKKKNQQPNATR
jgi:hypothetical protein